MTPSPLRSPGAGNRRPSAGRGALVAMLLCLVLGAVTTASQKPAAPAAPRPAPAAATIAFGELHSLTSTVDYLKRAAAASPGLAELVEIGKSAGNRPIYVLVVSNMKIGVTIDALVPLQHPRTPAVNNVVPMKPYQGKPGQWIDGGLRGLDPLGTEACLYIADKLLSGYASDPEIAKLVDGNAFYLCPVPNPDAFAAVSEAKPGTKAASGPDLASNFPEGWWRDDETQGGAGDYPASMPESRAILEFFTNHTNILLAQSFDVTGGAGVRPFARWPESRLDARDIAVLDRLIGKKYLELVGETVPASWSTTGGTPVPQGTPIAPGMSATGGTPAPQGRGRGGAAAGGGQAGRASGPPADQPKAWRSPYNAERQAPAGFGLFYDWALGQFGAWAMSVRLTPEGAAPGAAIAKACDVAWQLERFKATLLPRVEIRDATAKVLYTSNQATRAIASQEGDAVTVKKSGAPGRYKVVQVTATVENSGVLPTHVARGALLRGNREDVIWLLGDRTKVTFLDGSRWLRLGVLDGTLALPAAPPAAAAGRGAGGGGGGRGGRGGGGLPLDQLRQQPPETAAVRQAGNRRVVSWLVAVEGDTPLKLALTSQKGGTSVRDLTVQ